MSALLLKDFYVLKKLYRSYLIIAAVFVVISYVADGKQMFFLLYPCLICGMIPLTLLGYDEQSRWLQYCGGLPYTKGQIVSSKYLVGLIAQTAMLLVTGIAHAVKLINSGAFELGNYLFLMLMLLSVSTLASSVSLPFIFKLGTEKGRPAYYVMIGVLCAVSVIASGLVTPDTAAFRLDYFSVRLCIVGMALYALSWFFSVRFYEKREVA